MGRGRGDDEATRVDASILRKHRERKEVGFDEATEMTEVMRPRRAPPAPTSSSMEVTLRTKRKIPDLSHEPIEGTIPRATVAGRMDRDEAPPLPFEVRIDSAPPPPAVDLYGDDETDDPLNTTGRLERLGGSALPFENNPEAPAPPSVVHEVHEVGDPGIAMTETSTMLHKVHEDVLPFDGPQPKYPPRKLVPLEQNPLYAGGTSAVVSSRAGSSSSSRRMLVVVLVVVAILAAVLLVVRGAGP